MIVHFAFGAIDVPQLFVCAKGAAAWMLAIVRVPVWLFHRVTLLAGLVVPVP